MRAVAYVRLQGLLVRDAPGPALVAARGRVLDLSGAAARAGARPGQPLRAARLACPRAAVCPFDPAAARERSEPFLRALAALTPYVEPDGPLAAYVEIPPGRAGGADPLARAAAELAALARVLVPACGHRLEAGLGPNRLVARLAADLLREPVPGFPLRARRLPVPAGEAWLLAVPGDRVAAALAPLPLARLPLPAAIVDRLRRLGLERVGDVARLSPGALAGVLGAAEAARVVRLAQGEDGQPVSAAYPPPFLLARRRWAEAVTALPALHAALDGLAAELAAALQRRGRAAGTLWLWLETERGPVARVRRFTPPTAGELALRYAARRLLEREPLPAPVEGVALEARDLADPPAAQAGIWQGPAVPREAAAVRAALGDRLPLRWLRAGGELTPSRRERLLACFDPLRAPV